MGTYCKFGETTFQQPPTPRPAKGFFSSMPTSGSLVFEPQPTDTVPDPGQTDDMGTEHESIDDSVFDTFIPAVQEWAAKLKQGVKKWQEDSAAEDWYIDNTRDVSVKHECLRSILERLGRVCRGQERSCDTGRSMSDEIDLCLKLGIALKGVAQCAAEAADTASLFPEGECSDLAASEALAMTACLIFDNDDIRSQLGAVGMCIASHYSRIMVRTDEIY